jgi:plastocyanin
MKEVFAMRWFPRILIAMVILVSGTALTPFVDLPIEQFSWQLYSAAYQPSPVEVSIQDFAYTPDPVHVPVGTTVRWTNNDNVEHTVTSDTGLFDSDGLDPGESFEYRFDVPGTYPYHCEIHPSMQGTVIVAEVTIDSFLPIIMKASN